jgi:hypothetical protein
MAAAEAPSQADSFWAEYPLPDVLIALGAASVFLLLCAIALKASARIDGATAEPEPERAPGAVVKVMPVFDLDTPLLALGGKPDPTKLPDRSIKKSPRPRAEQQAQVSSAAEKTVDAIPPPDLPVAEKATPPPPPDAEVTKQVDAPVVPTAAPAPPANVPQEGHSDGVAGGTETDPLKARAVDLYRARIIAWFASRFRVGGSGLPQEELVKYRASATVDIGPSRAVVGFSLSPSGNATFDAAARAALESARGQTLPPPPDAYPDIVQSRISLTFVCKEHRCD